MINVSHYLSRLLKSIPVGARLHLSKDTAADWQIERFLKDEFERDENLKYSTPEEETRSGRAAEWVFERVSKDAFDALG